jgi:hypothetical protein
MNGVLRTALQFYTRTRAQRWMLAGALLLFAAQLLTVRRACPCPRSFSPWPFVLGGLAGSVAAMLTVFSAWDFRRISALRTVFLIPHSKLQLACGMLLAQLVAAAVGMGLVILVGHSDSTAPLAWGSPRGTFEILFGCALSFVVLLQLITGPSRIVSVVSLALLAPLAFRIAVFMQPEIFGLPKADVLALAGILAWFLFAAWFVSAWRPVTLSSVWARGRDSVIAPVQVSRQTAIHAFLLGQPSLLRVCRQQLATWMLYHLIIVAMLAGMKLLIARHNFPANYTMAIVILLYAPIVGVNTIAGCAARGARRVWLCSGESRIVLYAIAVRLAWQSLAILGIPLFSLALIEMRFLPHAGFDDMLLPLAICATLTPSALYLGLLNFRRRLNLSFLALYTAAAGAMMAGIFVESAQGRHVLWFTPVAFLAIGCVLAAIAPRRWRGIDWLRFRAERERSPFAVSPQGRARSAGHF